MNNEDKQIIGTMINKTEEGLREEIKKTEEGLREEIKKTEEGLRKEIKASEQGLREEIKASEQGLREDLKDEMATMEKRIREDLGTEIRHNGFLMERMEESISQIAEGQEFIRTNLEQINARLDFHQIERMDPLWDTVKDHSKRIKKLETVKAN